MTIFTRIWLRYRVARLFWVTAKTIKTNKPLTVAIILFEFFRPNPRMKITITKKASQS